MQDNMNEESTINSKDAFLDLCEVKKVFDLFGVRLFITYGACLGWVRQKDFIPYDDDIDLVVTDKIDYKTRKEIGWKLLNLGFEPQPIAFNVCGRLEPSEPGYNGDNETGIIVCHKRINITIFFFKEEDCPQHGKEMVCIPKYGGMKLICSPSKFYEKGELFKFKGVKFLVPSPVKEYLKFTYGDWKKKIKGKHAMQYTEYHDIINKTL